VKKILLLLILLGSCLCCSVFSQVLPRGQEKLSPTSTSYVHDGCSLELIRLGEELLADPSRLEKLHDRLRQIDTSDNMTIAVELMDNKRLKQIIEKEREECHLKK
jgi:hypothetical protein